MQWVIFVSEAEAEWGIKYSASQVPPRRAAEVVWSVLRRKNAQDIAELSGKKSDEQYSLRLVYRIGREPKVKKDRVKFSASPLPTRPPGKEPPQEGDKYILTKNEHILWAARQIEAGNWAEFTFTRTGEKISLQIGWGM